jgi:hypothetical protein
VQARDPSSPGRARVDWAAAVRLGAVASASAAALAVLAYVFTPLPPAVIIAVLGLGALVLSWHASATRPVDAAVLPGPGLLAHAHRRRRRAPRPGSTSSGGLTA